MKRRLVTLATLTSLLLCAATIALWVRDYLVSDHIERRALSGLRFTIFSIRSTGGLIVVNVERHDMVSEERAAEYRRTPDRLTGGFGHHSRWTGGSRWLPDADRWLGHVWHGQTGCPDYSGTSTYVGIPYWLTATVTALLPAMWLVARIRRRGPSGVFCATCGYDLRATPERCPECGGVPARVR